MVHLLTAIPDRINPRRISHDFAQTNRLRTEGTLNLVDAAARGRSQTGDHPGLGTVYEPNGADAATEDVPFWQHPPKEFRPVLDALRHSRS